MFNQSRIGKYMRRSISLILVLSMVILTGCGSKTYKAGKQLDIGVLPDLPVYGELGMAYDNAVIAQGEEIDAANYNGCYAAMLVDETTKDTIVAHNVHGKIYPASMTKIMTGILVMESIEKGDISLDDVVTLNRKVTFDDWDAMASDLVGGCSLTVKNLLYGLMITSYNDCGVILAELIAGSESAFCDMTSLNVFKPFVSVSLPVASLSIPEVSCPPAESNLFIPEERLCTPIAAALTPCA